MTPSIRLGKLFGIQIGLNWSLIFVFALYTWSVATQILPAAVPGQPPTTYWIYGVIGAAGFYVSLLAHEMSHALVATRNGIRVAGITLWLFGGVSQLEDEPRSAASEGVIAGVGPVTSVVLGGLALGVAIALPDSYSPLVANLLAWLGLVNLALAAFNLVPAFPLDGGRLLSSFFWWRSGSRQRGVHSAVRIGRVFAYLMIAGGVVAVVMGNAAAGVWIAFIGWFLLSAGSSEEAGMAVRANLRRVPVSAAMTSPVVTIPEWVTVEQFLESVAHQHRFTTFPVHEPSGKLTGVVRLADALRVPPQRRGDTHLRDVARPIDQVPTTRPDEDLAALIERLGATFDQRVLVFDQGSLVGILSPIDVARVLAARQALGGSRTTA